MNPLIQPDDCASMAELRKQIDVIDRDLVALLATRSGYIDRAVALKRHEGLPARTTERVAQVLNKVSDAARDKGLDPQLARSLWTVLIEWSIRREIEDLGDGYPTLN